MGDPTPAYDVGGVELLRRYADVAFLGRDTNRIQLVRLGDRRDVSRRGEGKTLDVLAFHHLVHALVDVRHGAQSRWSNRLPERLRRVVATTVERQRVEQVALAEGATEIQPSGGRDAACNHVAEFLAEHVSNPVLVPAVEVERLVVIASEAEDASQRGDNNLRWEVQGEAHCARHDEMCRQNAQRGAEGFLVAVERFLGVHRHGRCHADLVLLELSEQLCPEEGVLLEPAAGVLVGVVDLRVADDVLGVARCGLLVVCPCVLQTVRGQRGGQAVVKFDLTGNPVDLVDGLVHLQRGLITRGHFADVVFLQDVSQPSVEQVLEHLFLAVVEVQRVDVYGVATTLLAHSVGDDLV